MNPYLPHATRDLVFVDSETSGTDPDFHEVIEIAAVRTTHDLKREVGVVDLKIQMRYPERASAEALAVNHYSPAEWKNAVSRRVAYVEMMKLFDAEVMYVGQNPIFDLNFFRVGFREEGFRPLDLRYVLDTASMAWPLVVKGVLDKMNLETLCARYGIPNTGSHRAMADVRRLMHVYARMLGIGANLPAKPAAQEEVPEWARI